MTGEERRGAGEKRTDEAGERGEAETNQSGDADESDSVQTPDARPDEPSSGGPPSLAFRARVRLAHIRTHSRAHRIALLVAIAVGLALAWVHWFGLIFGGALVGVVSPSARRAVVAALGFGVIVLVAFAVTLGGSLGQALGMAPATYLAIGAALGLPVFGSLVRGLG